MRRVAAAFDRAFFGPESSARLWFVHTALAVCIAIRAVAGPYRRLDPTPEGLFRPPPLLTWLPEMPSATVIAVVQVVAGLAAALFVARRWPRATFAVLWLAYLFLAGLRDSRGKIMHNDVVLLLASFPFLFAPLVRDRRDREPDGRYGWPIRTGIAVVSLAYFFAGYWKVMRSGLAWVFSENVRLSIAWGPKPEVGRWDALADLVTSVSWFGIAIAAVTIAFELTFPVAFFVPRARIAYASIATLLHVSTYFLFGLDYWAWIAVLWVLFVDWPDVASRRFFRASVRSPKAGVAGGTFD